MANLRMSLCVVIICVLALTGVACAITAAAETGAKTILVFPLDNEAGAGNSQVAMDISARLADGLSADGGYNVVMYSTQMPFVQRLIATNPQKKFSATGPFARDAKAVADSYVIAEAASVSLAVIGSLDRCGANDKNILEASATVQILDVKKKQVIQTIAASGSATSESAPNKEAAISAADRIIEQITGKRPGMVTTTPSASTTPVGSRTTVLLALAYPQTEEAVVNSRNKQAARGLQLLLEKNIPSTRMFTVVRYTADFASLRRAVKEGTLKVKDITAPTDTTRMGAARAQKLARLMGADTAIIGSIDSLTVEDAKANLTATIQVISARTGKVDMFIAVNGSAAKSANENEKDLISKAIADASAKICSQLGGPAATP